MNVCDAAVLVLREAGRPLHVNEITERLLSRGLWKTKGRTPAATVGARIYTDIRKNRDASRFIRHAPSTFGLRKADFTGETAAENKTETSAVGTAGTQSGTSFSFIDSGRMVLEKFAGRKPMHYLEITKKAIEMGWLLSEGETPEASMNAQIGTSIKRSEDRGEQPLFTRHGNGLVGLSKWKEMVAGGAGFSSESSDEAEPETAVIPSRKAQKEKSFSFTESAEKVLEQFADRQPMHYREVTEKAIEMGWLLSEGKTPEASMYAQILTSVKRSRRRGEQPLFTKHGKGLVGLSKWMATGLALEIENHNRKVRKELHKKLLEMPWDAFEDLVARLLSEMGFEEIEVTSRAKDGGIDVRGTLLVGDVIRTRMAVQVKRWKSNIQAPVVQQVRGSLGAHEQGLIITTSDFSKGAREEADRKDATPVALMKGEQLVVLLVENGVGVERRSHELIELESEEDFLAENAE